MDPQDSQTLELVKGHLVSVRSTDGREISIKALVGEDARKAKEIIEGRMKVYATPQVAQAVGED